MADAPAPQHRGPEPATTPSEADELVLVALGSNLGHRERHLALARAAIAALPGTRLLAASTVEETAPLPPATAQPAYLNQMLALRTTLAPLPLLDLLLEIERRAGRERASRWSARTLDCDLVRFGDRTVAHVRLTLPHPGLPHREFWQRELRELAASPAVGAAA